MFLPIDGQFTFSNYVKDSYIIIEGHSAECFFIIHQGRVRIIRETEKEEENESQEILKPGDFFGVISTMASRSHIETAQAITDLILIKIQKHQYAELIQKAPQVSMRIIKLFSKQLRFLNETLAGLILKKTVIASPSHLFQVAEYYFKHNLYCQAFYSYTKYIKYCPNEDKTSAAKERLTKIEGFVKNKIPEFGTEVTRIYPKSNMLFAEGEPGDELFIIQKGIVKVSKIVDDNEMILAMLEAGDIFGEMALMENKPRLANAVAFEDCTVMVVNKTNFEYFSASHPQLIYRVTAILSERIWLVNKKLSNTLIINPLCHMYEALLVQLEKNRIPFTTKTPYTFNFGFPELCNMVGVSERDGRILIEKMLKNEIVRKTGNKIIAASVIELVMEAESYRKMEAIEKNKQGYEW